ncbi:hypothetical protein RJ641_017232 [Dillenia turbinata]|uniref:RING-type domain-containing protein n=1 Tax=Dillenia turbinata TaxID=194707 RepID=A0AAN8Z0C9_9MAGN
MNSSDRKTRWKSFKQRLGLSCCGSSWSENTRPLETEDSVDFMSQTPAGDRHRSPASEMNLAAALAAERNLRAARECNVGPMVGTARGNEENAEFNAPQFTPLGSLMRMVDGFDGVDLKMKKSNYKGRSSDQLCCVCMERKKGAAFIPCGHTYCRVCSRELWLNRVSCPICNRSILEILDIF